MTQLQQKSCFLNRRKLRDTRIRHERVDAGLLEHEPKFVRAYRFEFGVREKVSGETAWHDLKSVRHAAKALGLVLKYI